MTLFKYTIKTALKNMIILLMLVIFLLLGYFNNTNSVIVHADTSTNYSTYLYEIKSVDKIKNNVSFQSDYFTFEKSNLHAIPYARTYDDLLSPTFLGQGKTFINDNCDLYFAYDSTNYSAYSLIYNYANSHIYFNDNPSNLISFYLPSIHGITYGSDSNSVYYENLFKLLDIEEITIPYISINGKRYVSLYYSNNNGIKLLLENNCTITEEKYEYTSNYGSVVTNHFYRINIPNFKDPKITNIDILDIKYYYNVFDTTEVTNTWEEFDIRFIPHSSMDSIMYSMPFEIKSFDIEKEKPEIIIDYSTFTGIVTKHDSFTNWNYTNLDLRMSPSEWAFCSSATFRDGHVGSMRRNLYDINLLLTENKDYYDENGVLHKNEDSKERILDTSIDHTYSPPGGTKYSGGIIDGLDIQELKDNNSYGTIKINDLSFYVYLTNLNNAFVQEEDLVTLDFSNISSVYYTYDSRPTTNVFYYNWDENGYFMTGAGAKIDNVYYGDVHSVSPESSGAAAALLNLFELIGTSIEGATNVMQVYGFDFYFDKEKLLPINNVQSIKFDFIYNGNRYQRFYTETDKSAFERFFLKGYDECMNILTDHDSWPEVCERLNENHEEIIFDYALVHHVGNKKTGKYLEEFEALEITYLTEDFSLKQAVSNDLGLHEVDGQLYDKDGNLRLDYKLNEVELTDDNGNKYMGFEITDKDGNKVNNTGTHIETISKNPIDNLVDGKYDDLFNTFGESFEKILMLVGILILVVILGYLAPIFSVVFKTLIKCITWSFKGILLIISAPFKLIGSLFKPKKRNR